jgi:signal transduction histidine kinase
MSIDEQAPPESGDSNPRTSWRSSIVWKLTVFVGFLVAFNDAVLIGVAYMAMSSILRDEVHQRLSTVAVDRKGILATAFEKDEERATQFARRQSIEQFLTDRHSGRISDARLRAEAEPTLITAQTNIAGALAIWLESETGEILASSGPEKLVAQFKVNLRAEDRTKATLVGYPRRVNGIFGALFTAPVTDRAGRYVGSAMLLTDFGGTAASIADSRGLDETGEILVGVVDAGRIRLILSTRLEPSLEELDGAQLPPLAEAADGKLGFTSARDYRGENVLVDFRPISGKYPGWGLVAKIDTAEAYRPVRDLRGLLLSLGGAALALGLAASNAIARRFARPIRRLAKTSSAVAAGDLSVRSEVRSNDEIGALSDAFNIMTEELARSYSMLERRIQERTRELEAVRDLLDAFFKISTSRQDPDNIEKTYDSVLRFCSRLGYDLAMISLVDHDGGVIRAVRATGTMTELIERTVRRLDCDDVLAEAVRENRVIVVPDSTRDSRCDQPSIRAAGIRGQVVLPLVSDGVLGTLQVAMRPAIDPSNLDLRPLETLAIHTARALTGLHNVEEIRRLNLTLEQRAGELARSEAALREQTRILQSVLDCMGDGVVVADALARFLIFNPAAERILGLGRIDDRPFQEWPQLYGVYRPDRATPFPVDDLPLIRAIRGESVDEAELYIANPSQDDGTWILVTGRPLRDDHGGLEGGVIAFQDITRRKRSERRLAAQYETTRVLAEADSPVQATQQIVQTVCESLDWDLGAFWRVDSHTQRLRSVTFWHRPEVLVPKFEAMTRSTTLERGDGLAGRVWALGQPVWFEKFPSDSGFVRRYVAEEEGLKAAFAVPVTLRGDCLGVLEFFSTESRAPDPDILEMIANVGTQIGQFFDRYQMRTRVNQSEKLASLGLLSAGVAHEINNPLAYVANNLAVLERDVRFLLTLLSLYEQGDEIFRSSHPELWHQLQLLAEKWDLPYVKENMGTLLNSTRQGVKRVADIVQNLRGFARLDRASVDQADVHEAIRTAAEMIRGRLGRRLVTIDERLGDIPLVTGSAAQLNQVFLNLLVNAMHAIETTNRADGKITITTETRGNEVVVTVADNGCGIPEEIMPQIFDPFFTTKGVGDGTGLGLSITHSMVQDHGGRMEVESAPGQGSRFRVILPVGRPARTSVS